MIKKGKIIITIIFIFFAGRINAQDLPVDYVNMMIGTSGQHPTEYGGLIPEVSTPFGMTKWCAATRQNRISSRMYHYDDSLLIGYMGSHQPVIWMGDYGFLTIMPQVNMLKTEIDKRAVSFSHKDEYATPYYYKNSFNSQNGEKVTTEITATSRCSYFRINYPKSGEGILFFEASRETNPWEGNGGYIKIFPEKNEIHVYNTDHQEEPGVTSDRGLKNFAGYYVLKFDKPFTGYGTWQREEVFEGKKEIKGRQTGGFVRFKTGTPEVNIRIGSSFISFAQAEENLMNEIPEFKSFDEIVEQSKQEWNELLGKVKVKSENKNDLIVFYSMLFRTLQYPRDITEYGKYYSAFDGKIHEGISYNAFSLWDTFRSLHPWLQIIVPGRVSDMMQSLVQMYEQGGWMPKWPNLHYTNSMIGTPGDIVIADAWINGFRDFDIKTAWSSMMKNAFIPQVGNEDWRKPGRPFSFEGRAGLREYIKLGYVAADSTRQAASRTLEFALADFAIAKLAKELGFEEEFIVFEERSKYYRNIFNPEVGYFQARNFNGNWVPDEESHRSFTEGSYWTYMFCVMQDPLDLISLMGGIERYVSMLDKNFEEGHYRHDNEPGHHYAYMYNHAGFLNKTQQRIPPIIKKNYQNRTDGLSGNDDAGQMAAWYIFSTLGFYPLTPTSGEYALGIPYFEEIILDLPDKNTLTIRAKGISDNNFKLNIIRLNGKILDRPFVKIEELKNGGYLEFSKN